MEQQHPANARFGFNAFGILPTLITEDADQAIEIVRRRLTDHRLEPANSSVRLQFRSAPVEDLTLNFVGYNVPVQIDASPLSGSYLICFPVRGHATIDIGGSTVRSDVTHAAVLPPNQAFTLHWHDSSPQVVLSVPRARLREVAHNLFGAQVAPKTKLPHTLDLNSSVGRSLVASIVALHEDVNSGAIRVFPKHMRRNLEEGVLARLLSVATATQPSLMLEQSPGTQSGKLVALFLDLAEATATEGLTPGEAAGRLGVPLRTLQEHTHRELQATPGELLTRARLQRARRALQLADPASTTVTMVAIEFGFRHAGRFSQIYREAFGERPSDTLLGRDAN